MLDWLEQFLVRYPELALFLVISAGYWIGSFKFVEFSLGPVTGSLFAGILLGQFAHVPVSAMTKSFLFLLFLFGIGYSVGPQFMQALRRDGLKPILLTLVVGITALSASLLISKILKLDPGFAAGMMSGALTQSAAMGTATDAINGLPLPEAEKARLVAHVAVGDAVCYVFGAAGAILFATAIAPALLRIDLKVEAAKLEEALGMSRAKPGLASAWRKFELRAYRLPEGAPSVGSTVAAAEAGAAEHRLFIHRLRREGRIVEAEPGLVLQAGDVIAVSGPRQVIIELVGARAEEVEDKELLDVPVTTAQVMLTNPKIAGRSLADASGEDWTRGLYLRSLTRGGQDIPIAPGVVLQRGDLCCMSSGRSRSCIRPPEGSASSWPRRRRSTSWCWALQFSLEVSWAFSSPSRSEGSRSRSARAWAPCSPDFWSATCARIIRYSDAFPMEPSPS
jgi:putative transport protein